MLVREVLARKGTKVFTIHPDLIAAEVCARLRSKRIGAAVVVDRWGKVAGIISERDVVYGIGRYGKTALGMAVGELMTTPAPTCTPDDEIGHIMALMTHRRVRHVAVMNGGLLAGIVSIGDVVKHRLDEMQLEVNVMRDYFRGGLATGR